MREVCARTEGMGVSCVVSLTTQLGLTCRCADTFIGPGRVSVGGVGRHQGPDGEHAYAA